MTRNPVERASLACNYAILLVLQSHIVEARSWWSLEIPALDAIRDDDPLYAPSSALLMEDNSFMYDGSSEFSEDRVDSSSQNFYHVTIGLPVNSDPALGNESSYQTVERIPTKVPSSVPNEVPEEVSTMPSTAASSATVYGKINDGEQPTFSSSEQYDNADGNCPPNHDMYLLRLYDLVGDGWGSTKLVIKETSATSRSGDTIFVGSLDASNGVVTYEAGVGRRGLRVNLSEKILGPSGRILSLAQGFAGKPPEEPASHAKGFANGLEDTLVTINGKGDENESNFGNQTSINAQVCLQPDACYTAKVSGGTFLEEVRWEITRVHLLETVVNIGSVVAAGVGAGAGVCDFSVDGSCETTCDGELLLIATYFFPKRTLNLTDHRTGTVQNIQEKQPTTASPTTTRPTNAPVGTSKRPTSNIIPRNPASSSSVNVVQADDSLSAEVNEYVRVRDVIVFASPSSKMAIADKNSTQSRALRWLFTSNTRGLSELRLVQRWVLASFYYATNGDEWVVRLGWMGPRDECEWYGVTCIGGVIGKLELIHNRLVGELVAEMSTWKNLYWLSLGNDHDAPEEEKNEFITPLPSFLGDLTTLAFLNLANVGLTSTIPQELFTSWSRLKSLFLNDNDITGTLPKSIEHLDSIEVLWLGGNNLGGSILPEIGRLVSLRDLSLKSNFRVDVTGKRGFVTTIPSEIGQLTSLEILSLADNALSGLVPMHLGSLVSLRRLQLSANFFERQLPPALGKLEMLEELDISLNWYVLFVCCSIALIIVRLRTKVFLCIPGFLPQSHRSGGTWQALTACHWRLTTMTMMDISREVSSARFLRNWEN
jgi:hypothetical protein